MHRRIDLTAHKHSLYRTAILLNLSQNREDFHRKLSNLMQVVFAMSKAYEKDVFRNSAGGVEFSCRTRHLKTMKRSCLRNKRF